MKKVFYLLIIFSILLLAFPDIVTARDAVVDPYEAYLRAGKPKDGVDDVVGGIQVWNDAEKLYVQFETQVPWCMTEVHLQVANDLSSIPGKSGTVISQRIASNLEYEDCNQVRGPYVYNLGENGWTEGSNLVIAAHVVVGESSCTTECEILDPAPYGAFKIVAWEQGLQKNGSPVPESRSDPTAVLTWDTSKLDTDFFSLGFGGWIEVEFDCPISNGEGDDFFIIEDTWGPYLPETAEVYASTDGENWIFLGSADNAIRDDTYEWQTVSWFDLGELESASYIKVIDSTPADPMPDNSDGYDLNSIQSLQDCEECSQVCNVTNLVKAWAGNKTITGSLWARYVRYLVK